MDFETLKNDFLLADGASGKIRFATKNWVIWATLFTLTKDVAVVYYVDAAKNRDDVQKYGFSFEEKADLAAFVNRKTGRIILPNYHFRNILDGVPEEVETDFTTLTREAARKILETAEKMVEADPIPPLSLSYANSVEREAQYRYIDGGRRKEAQFDELCSEMPADILLDCFCEAPGWEEKAAAEWLAAPVRYSERTNRDDMLWKKSYEIAVNSRIKSYEMDENCVEHIRKDVMDAIRKMNAKNVGVEFLCADGSVSNTKIEGRAFSSYDSGASVSMLSLWRISPESERRRVAQAVGNEHSDMPFSSILRISYKGKTLWKKK